MVKNRLNDRVRAGRVSASGRRRHGTAAVGDFSVRPLLADERRPPRRSERPLGDAHRRPATHRHGASGCARPNTDGRVSPKQPPNESSYPEPATSTRDPSNRNFHSINTPPRSSSIDCGIGRPSALAVFGLINSSNSVGCATGSSAGFCPLRILST